MKKNESPGLSGLVKRCSGSRSRAWDITDRASELERRGENIIHLGVGDPDFDTPEEIIAAAHRSMSSGRTHYSPIPGESNLRKQIAMHATGLYGKTIEQDNVVVFPGAQCALFSTFLCLAEHGDEVILLEPAYATYDAVAEAGGARAVRVPLDAKSGFALDVEKIRSAITKDTKAILLNSPGNPTGAVFAKTAIENLVSLCCEKNIWLVSDEVYWSMVFDGEHNSPLSTAGAEERVIVVNSLSKSHAMTGWRIGWVIAPGKLSTSLASLSQALLFGVSQFSQDAATYALANDLQSVQSMVQTFQRRRDRFCAEMNGIEGISVYPPAGGMFLLVEIGDLGMNGTQFADKLLDETGVAVVPGFAFGNSVENFVRIGFLRDEEAMSDAASRIRRFVAQVRG